MYENSVRSIRNRLLILLMQAFAATVLLTALLILGLTTIFLSLPTRNNPLDRMPLVTRLETFYMVRGNWNGVSVILPFHPQNDVDRLWQKAVLVGTDRKIIIDHGQTDTSSIGKTYPLPLPDSTVPIDVAGKQVGALVLDPSYYPSQGRLTLTFLAPVVIISIFLALFTVVIGLLLMRRVVNPLSEVIAAAQAVAQGDLSTRVHVSGPDDFRALSDTFNHMADSLDRSDRERRDMLADIAHELRTPLTVMRGRLEGIVDGVYPPTSEQITPALEETYLLERLVEDLRLLTLAETRQLHFETKAVDLNNIVQRAIGLFQAEAEERNITLTLQTTDTPATANIDPQRTEQIVGNLLSNALRYVPTGGKIMTSVAQENRKCSITISDNGPGIPEKDLPSIFNRFWRGEKSRSRTSGGAGLGLSIARQLVEAQGGSISARNRPEGGLEIHCEFPAS